MPVVSDTKERAAGDGLSVRVDPMSQLRSGEAFAESPFGPG
jgi:hypothetical protein